MSVCGWRCDTVRYKCSAGASTGVVLVLDTRTSPRGRAEGTGSGVNASTQRGNIVLLLAAALQGCIDMRGWHSGPDEAACYSAACSAAAPYPLRVAVEQHGRRAQQLHASLPGQLQQLAAVGEASQARYWVHRACRQPVHTKQHCQLDCSSGASLLPAAGAVSGVKGGAQEGLQRQALQQRLQDGSCRQLPGQLLGGSLWQGR